MMLTKVTNIKVSVNCQKISLDTVKSVCQQNKIKIKIFSNFILIKSKFIYTIFKNKENNNYNHINITKIKSKLELKESIKTLKIFNLIPIKNTLKIDNVTGSLDLKKEIILRDLIKITETYKHTFNHNIFISYNNEKFPGAFLKIEKDNKKIGTIIIFHSGKAVFVGCKNIRQLKCLESFILALTSMR